MDMFFGLILLAIVVEGIVTYVKTFIVDGKLQWQIIAAIVLGIVVSVAYNIDLMAIFGLVSTIPYIGCILTGILISRGANYIFDLIGKITKNQLKSQ